MNRPLFNFLLLVFAASLLADVGADDWPQFRGPDGQGNALNRKLPTTWSEDSNVSWKIPLPGSGWSSPVVGGDQIFLTAAVVDEEASQVSLKALCFQAADGKLVWDVELFQQPLASIQIHRKNSHASPTPVLDGSRLFVHFGPYGTACLKTDGNVVWKNTELVYKPTHGNGGSPALINGMLVVCCDGQDKRFVVGLKADSGKVDWRIDRQFDPAKGFSFCTPTPVQVGDRTLAICPGSGGVFAYDAATGEQIWRVAYGEGYSVVPRPVVGNGLVYVCSGFGDSQLFAIDPTGSGDVTDSHVKWKTKKGVPKSPSIMLVDREIFMVDDRGVVTCLNALNGDDYWQERIPGKYSASPTCANGMIYFQNETGTTTVILADREFETVATNKLGDGKAETLASFACVENAILLRSQSHLYRLEAAK